VPLQRTPQFGSSRCQTLSVTGPRNRRGEADQCAPIQQQVASLPELHPIIGVLPFTLPAFHDHLGLDLKGGEAFVIIVKAVAAGPTRVDSAMLAAITNSRRVAPANLIQGVLGGSLIVIEAVPE
jgi:hypothetical protein